jgi:hypothetical protein
LKKISLSTLNGSLYYYYYFELKILVR